MADHPVFLPGKSHGQRGLVEYSPWDRKESDPTERLHFHFTLYFPQSFAKLLMAFIVRLLRRYDIVQWTFSSNLGENNHFVLSL